MTKYTPVIGLEIHVELKTASKMFCGCANDPFSAKSPNIYTCPVCLGLPGALPVPNKKAIDWTIKLGLALDCKINYFSKFDRKNYFYADLAKGYQISQYDIPFCYEGKINTSQGEIRITRIHLEEDTGKLLHDTVAGKPVSLIDFNRSGVPLVEIVSEPDIKNGTQAQEYGKKLRRLMRYLNIADCKMAQGGMRLEANISLAPAGTTELPNYKVEVKNINSFKFLEQAIDYEIDRQTKLLDQGQTPVQETRGWDANKQQTFSQRTKEAAEDYRYFPDPDIPPIEFTKQQISAIKKSLPKLPEQVIARWQDKYQLSQSTAEQLSASQEQVAWIDQILTLAQQQQLSPLDIINDLINKKIKVKVNDDAQAVVTQFKTLHQTVAVDQDQLDQAVTLVISQNPDAVAKYKAGKTQVLGFLMGQIMAQLKTKVDPQQIKIALTTALK